MFVSCKIIPTMKSPLLGYTFFLIILHVGKLTSGNRHYIKQ